ncbi:MAG: Rossmann-like and DUF2520 domain-containing protein [Ignavibacteriaceae bacterium]
MLSEIRIVIIGAGKISYSLSEALTKSGFNIVSVISSNIKSAQKLSSKFKIEHYSDRIEDIPSSANFYILSVPDNQIYPAARQIASLKLNFRKCIFIHLSGVENSEALKMLKKRGGRTASFHIMQTFPSKKIISIKGCYTAIETEDKKTINILSEFAHKLKLFPFQVSPDSKILYHLSGVYASNFLTGNFFIAEKLFKMVSPENFALVISPIISTTLNNISKRGTVNSLSGPIERGDNETILKHLSALNLLIKKNRNNAAFKLLKQNYIIQSLNLLELIGKREAKPGKPHREIKNILKAELKL